MLSETASLPTHKQVKHLEVPGIIQVSSGFGTEAFMMLLNPRPNTHQKLTI